MARSPYHRLGLFAASIATLSLCSACGNSTAGTAEALRNERVTNAAEEFTPYPESDYVAEEATRRTGGTVRLATNTDIPNLDPHGVAATYIEWVGRLLFDNLVYRDARGNIQPWLAESWKISSDGLTYTFHLRKGVTFSDGAVFNAEAVHLNFERMRDPATRSPLAARYIAPYASGRVVDEYTFEARLQHPYTPFLHVLAQGWLAMISPKQIRENSKSATVAPVGSGPYTLESFTRQQSLSFVRRPDYNWAPPYIQHRGPAHIERVILDIIPEDLVRYSGLLSGDIDLLFEAPPQNAAKIRSNHELVLDKRIREGVPTRALSFNVEQPPFDDLRVRRAVAQAVDAEGLIHLLGFGEYAVKHDFLAANTRFYNPGFSRTLSRDVELSERLLDEAGWTGRDSEGFRTRDGKRLQAVFSTSERSSPGLLAVAIQADLKRIGFDLRIESMPASQLTERRRGGQFQAISAGVWHTNTPDALYITHHSGEINEGPRTGQNTSRLRDPLLDQLLEKARATEDIAALQDLYSQAQQRVVELVPAVPLYEHYSLVAYRKRLRGVLYDTSHNTPVFVAAWLEKTS